MEEETNYVCKDCGSEDVEQLGWVNLNTGLPNGSPYDRIEEPTKNYCNECNEHTIIILK